MNGPEIFLTRPSERAEYARAFAIVSHGAQRYGSEPYYAHTDEVVAILAEFGFVDGDWTAAGHLHDVPEDTGVTLLEIEQRFGNVVRRRVESVSGFGDNRRARNDLIHHHLRHDPGSAPLKAADRLANLRATFRERLVKTAGMYLKEEKTFMALMLECDIPSRMYRALEEAYGNVRAMLAEETGLAVA